MKKFKEEGTTGKATPLPFSAMVVGGFLWSLYGHLTSDMTLIAPNVTTIGFGCYYLFTFRRYRHPQTSLSLHILGAITVIFSVFAAALALEREDAVDMIGQIGCVQQVVMFSGPLAVIKTVLREKNTAAMSAWFTVATFLSCSVWSLYGLMVTNDVYIWGPNAVGLLAAAAQIFLFLKFGLPPPPHAVDAIEGVPLKSRRGSAMSDDEAPDDVVP
eukprot:CAMPEP_0181300524 /NCGR_PEP_ID=MMETSP1101-20121128/6935_1 /TAXON_ID=46948 /ORGANISM="Rhodomonas abbreviata, Strain Caron Lab Isolate" /LENGTH=214 /DNA_ID=CAMNT_0023405765 /DNA_START=178 /DNA_END=822 /DNA_ORIENTATION=+